MRVQNVGNARSIYYDRNPKSIPLFYSAGLVAPHASTQRWAYTVPANRKAFLEYFMAESYRDTQFFPPGVVIVQIYINLVGNVHSDLVYFNSQDGRLFITYKVESSVQALLQAGDQIAALTVDLSTGGTNAYDLSAKLIEFDA